MSPAKKHDETPCADPETPRRASAAKPATTPTNRRASAQAGVTPKSAPAAAGHGSSQKKKPEPTLLGDFFLGRQSPARVAAQREALKQRRKSMAADAANVREELRQEMRAAAVRRVQQPGGVRDRVKAWQKANAAAMREQGGGVPHAEDVATEPTEVAAHVAPANVTEDDRERVKLRHKPKKRKEAKVEKAGNKENQDAEDRDDTAPEKPAADRSGSPSKEPPVAKLAPKKRIVSDDNWMKRGKGKNSPRDGPPKPTAESSPTPIPKDFLQRTAQNPSVQSKIRDWAERVEVPGPPRVKQYRHRKSGATVTAEEDAPSVVVSDPELLPTSKCPVDDDIRVKPMKPKKPKPDTEDGIRITPMRKKEPPDDGIRVRPIDSNFTDDGIRVRPIDDALPDDGIRVRPSRQIPADQGPNRPTSPRPTPVERRSRTPSNRREPASDDVVEVFEEPETETETPTKRKASRRHRRRQNRSPSPVVQTVEHPEDCAAPGAARRSPPQHDSDDETERIPPTVLGNKSLADIPFGYSAFSELDLPLGADARNSTTKKPKAQRNPSFKAMPKVLKKVVTGAKDIIHEMAEPPKPVVVNKPQSIESWLNDTVDPFVKPPRKDAGGEGPMPIAQAGDGESTPEPPRQEPDSQRRAPSRSTSGTRQRESVPAAVPKKQVPQESAESQQEDSDATPTKAKSPATPSTGLKRRRATRIASSPTKSGGRKPLRDLLKEAFRGESVGHKLPPTVYPSCETDYEKETESEEDDLDLTDERHRSTDPSKMPSESDYTSTYDSTLSSDLSSHGPPRRRPPTNGAHELSTIVSEGSSSTVGSETRSDVSQTTITQTTAFTKSTDISRQRSQKPGLKRRLTKHSDLVSVLSLPDDGKLLPPRRSKSIKSSRSLHRRPSRADKSRVHELLDEFADDEHFYGRELKALVDGVIPVLLRDVVDDAAADAKADAVAKAVVSMGVALEKLRDFHRRVPLSDIKQLLTWLEEVSPVYDGYLDVWRLGFQGLIINLAPRDGRFKDDDSLLNALPLNEDGDIVGENGERVDVAFLLKRPLIRVKWMVKFLKAAVAVTGTSDTERLLSVFETLQEKARKRHREETARMMDEDANHTDTTRCRDLRNLRSLDGDLINQARQVVALDVFALDLDHSSGQRLECQVELIYRDSPAIPGDKGDILIRELGNSTRPWLLFPPVPRQHISARRSDVDQSLVVMIRGTHNGNEWFELLKLSTNSEEQVDYWFDVLGSNPVPPAVRRPASMVLEATPSRSDEADIPVGERRHLEPRLGFAVPEDVTPPRYPAQQFDGPTTPPSSWPTSPSSPPYLENHSSDARKVTRPRPNTTPYREDGAPPPPIHRTLGPKSPGLLAPSVDLSPQGRLKRRISSPLKHEYHPSDISSDSSSSMSDDSSESSQSSSDELDEVPDTIPGYSIKESEVTPAESIVSEDGIAPSNSASQAGFARQNNGKAGRPGRRFIASVSYWSSRKGVWKDIDSAQPASIVVFPGCMEVHELGEQRSDRRAYAPQASGTSKIDNTKTDVGSGAPLIVLVLTPVVFIRRSTALDVEVRSPPSPEGRLRIEAGQFRFRSGTQDDNMELYEAVHESRENNAKYIQIDEERRLESFGQMQAAPGDGSADGDSSSRRRSWFGRRNSYRASTRAPSVSQGSVSTTISARSFLRRLMGGGNNTSYNIDESTLDKQPRPSNGSLYTSSGSSGGATTPPRSLSISLSGSGSQSQSQSRWSNGLAKPFSPDQPLEIRCHLSVHNNRWLDKGDCVLHISWPPPGVRQELPLYNGLEKRVVVMTHASRRSGGGGDRPLILLDAVLGSKCFSLLGTKGVMCSVWENLRDEEGNVGVAPRSGAVAGRVTKWCFQCKSVQQANWIMGVLTSEVPGLMMG